jgi:hypothetical protein
MEAAVWKILRAFAGRATAGACRSCGDGIPANDPFGASEGVCLACRLDHGPLSTD